MHPSNQQEQIVVFADMLGFAALTEGNILDVEGLVAGERILSLDLQSILQRQKNPLTVAFSTFHFAVNSQIHLASMLDSVTAITFSDSVFFATRRLESALKFASELTFSLMCSGVPIRSGISLGSFAALRFRSDILKDGGDHASQFLGTAVVRACKAESCGVKGMRVLIHPSIEALVEPGDSGTPASGLSDSPGWRIMELAEGEKRNTSGVRYELNYWDSRSTRESAAWHKLQEMWTAAPDSARGHYEATAMAINRMRIQQGEPPVKKLRLRTLPRRVR